MSIKMRTAKNLKEIFSGVTIGKELLWRKWFIRIAGFFLFLIPFLLIKNEFHMSDEYCFAIWLDEGKKPFHLFHMLSSSNGYFCWFLATVLGFKLSAFRALQVANSIMAAIGAVALLDLGIFWGLRWKEAILFSSPVFLSNAFIRYSTSAYPDAAALGIGLVAINLTIRAVVKQQGQTQKVFRAPFYISGMVAGLACLLHLGFSPLVSGFVLGIILGLRQHKQAFDQIWRSLFYYCFGFISIIGTGYIVLFLIFCTKGDFVEIIPLGADVSSWLIALMSFKNYIVLSKVFMALFFPGVHSSNHILELIFNIPRFSSFLVIFWLIIEAGKRHKNNSAVFLWFISMVFSIITFFYVLLFLGWHNTRQYAALGLAAFGPLFLAVGIVALRRNSKLFKIPMMIISLAVVFHMIFGIEGLREILSHDSRPLRKLYEKCDIHRPKAVQFPWNVGERSKNAGCAYIAKYYTAKYGAFGPKPSDVGLSHE